MYAKAEALIKPNIEGAASDFKGSMEWLRKSAEAGYLKAQTDLGVIYMYGGKDIKADWKEAYRWFSAAAEQGSAEAHQFLANMLMEGSKDVPADAKAAMDHLKIAAESALPEAMYRLGLIYISMENHAKEGMQLLENAAKAGMHDAARELGFAYASGSEYIARDMDKATAWFQKAADLGDAQSLYIIGMIRCEGQGIEKDTEKGIAALRLSAGQGFVPAMRALVKYLDIEGATEEMKKEAQAWKKHIDAYEAEAAKEAKKMATEAAEAVEQAPVAPVMMP